MLRSSWDLKLLCWNVQKTKREAVDGVCGELRKKCYNPSRIGMETIIRVWNVEEGSKWKATNPVFLNADMYLWMIHGGESQMSALLSTSFRVCLKTLHFPCLTT